MTPVTTRLLLLFLVLLMPGPALAEVTVQDDRGARVTLPGPARRIVSLYGGLSETLAAMDAGGLIVARTENDTTDGLADTPSVGTHMRPNAELVLELKPDLVLAGSVLDSQQAVIAQLEEQNVPVAVFEAVTFEELLGVIVRLGTLTGREEEARDLAVSMVARLNAVTARIKGRERPLVLFEVRYPNLLAAGAASMVNDVIQVAGGVNCVQERQKFVRWNIESVILCDPDVYLIQQGPMNRSPLPLDEREHYGVLQATRTGSWYVVDEEIFSRPGPRSVDAVEFLTRILHPDAWTDHPPGVGKKQ